MYYFSSGDAPFFFKEQMLSLSWIPQVWESIRGFGDSIVSRLWLVYPFDFVVKFLSSLGLTWGVIEKILWAGALCIGVVSIYRLATYVLGKQGAFLSIPIYLTNTYALFLFGGGQLGVSWAYAFSPFVLYRFIKVIDRIGRKEGSWFHVPSSSIKNLNFELQNQEPRTKNKELVTNGLWLALLVVFDLRLAYLVLLAIGLYFLFCVVHFRLKILGTWNLILDTFVLPLLVAAACHLFWILPMIVAGSGISGLGEDITNPGMLQFLSFADFSHALSLLHPNWPENLFGKVYFLQPEFLVLPILAFGALLFTNGQKAISNRQDDVSGQKTINNKKDIQEQGTRNREQIIYFSLLALLGVFLSKGAGAPFGEIYVWLFSHLPGFIMFRDPTKLYLFTAIGYSLLIPFTLKNLAQKISIKNLVFGMKYKNNNEKIILDTQYLILNIFFILFWCFTIRQLFLGQLTGNFRPQTIPNDYVRLKDMLVADTTPSRSLWIPETEKFAYSSTTHPVIPATVLFDNASLSEFTIIATSSSFLSSMNEAGVRYVIVPKDTEKKMFMSEYRFDPLLREHIIKTIEKTPLVPVPSFEDISVFENLSFTKMESPVPEIVSKQQNLAQIGLIISGSVIVILIAWFYITSKNPN